MAEPNFFDQYDPAPAQQIRAPDPRRPGELKIQEQNIRQNDQQLVNTQTQNDLNNYNLRSKPTYDRATAIGKVREDYRGDKRVLRYEESIPVYISSLDSPANPAGDLILVNAFAKTTDPATGVREGEAASVGNAQPQLDQLKAGLLKQFGDDGYGNFTPEGRAKLRQALSGRMRKLAGQYQQARNDHLKYIRSLNLPDSDAETIIGPHAGEPFQQAEAKYLGHFPTTNYRQGPNGIVDATTGAPIDPRTGERGPPPPQVDINGNPIGTDPEGIGDIGFNNAREAAPLPPGAQQFQVAFQQAIAKGEIPANPYAIIGWARQHGRDYGLNIGDIPMAQAKAAAEALKKGVIPQIATPKWELSDDQKQRIEQAKGYGGGMAFGAGSADVLSMGTSNKLIAGLNALRGRGDYLSELQVANEREDAVQKEHPWFYGGGQVAGAAALPNFGAKSVGDFAKVGAGYGAAYGAGSSDSLGEMPMNVLMGAGTGFVVPHILSGAGAGFKGIAAASGRKIFGEATPEQQAILAAGEAEGVPVNMGDVFPQARNSVATLETIPGSSGPVRSGIEAGRNAMEGRVAALGGTGAARTEGAMGERLYKAGERAIGTHDKLSTRDYGIAERLGGKVTAEPARAAQAVREVISDLSETPNMNSSTLNLYKDILGDFLDKNGNLKSLSIKAVKGMRRAIRQEMSNRGLTGSTEDSNLQRVVNAASEDMYDALAAHNPRAAAAYKKADEGYAERIAYINDTLQKFMGARDKPVSGEALMSKIRAMAGSGSRGNSRELAQFWRSLSDEEHADAAATIAAGLGRKSAEEPFSPGTFLTNIRNIDERSRIIIFGRSGARSIDNLIKLAGAKKASVDRLNNSRSGQVTNYRTVIASIFAGLPGGGAALGLMANAPGAGAAGGAAAAAVGVGGLALARQWAKALMNEEFTRLVANAPATTSPKAIDAHFGRLRQLATKDPSVRAVVEDLEKKIISVANDNLGGASRAAAQPETEQQNNQ